MASGIQGCMVRLTPLDKLRAIFASDDVPDTSRLHRIARIITLQITDSAIATALHQDIKAAISLYEIDPSAGRLSLSILEPDLTLWVYGQANSRYK